MKKLQLFLVVLIPATAVWVFYNFDPAISSFYPKCLFHSLTGFDCPGCGSQRALFSLLHGNVIRALDHNMLAVIGIPLGISGYFLGNFRHPNSGDPLIRLSIKQIFLLKVLVGVVILSFWILRNLPVAPFTFLASN